MLSTKKFKFFSLVPVEILALFMGGLIYTGILTPVNRKQFSSLIPCSSIKYVEGIIDSNPVKTSTGKYYSMQLKVTRASTSITKNYLTSQARGNILLIVNAAQVEALYPGKLYSKKEKSKMPPLQFYNTDIIVPNSINKQDLPIFETGARLRVITSWLKPDPKYNYSKSKSVFSSPYTTNVFMAKKIEHCGWTSKLTKIRAHFRLAFRKVLFLWGDAGGLLLALLSGTREYTNSILAESFKKAGLSHILALSGMHLSLFAGIAKLLGSITGGKRFSKFISPIIVICFVWFAGFSPSLFRALVCTFISMFVSLCFMTPRFSATLSLAFLLQISFFPQDSFSPAFILSYGALIGIIIGEKIFSTFNNRFLPPEIASGFTAAEGAQICTAPVTIGLFGSIMPIGLISSVIVSPLASIFLVFGLCCIILGMVVPILMSPLGFAVQFFYTILEHIVLFFSQFPSITF
ncbi:MAG: hypothetical protein BKP49_08670 [Treponema sp. CETP13]|nr:MAG: hypothetical protein BKP49_08670 [Treponema sp. CETP13]